MNKRSFFKSLGAAVVGVYLGLGIKKIAPKVEEEGGWELKPGTEFISVDLNGAECLVYYAVSKEAFKAIHVGPPPGSKDYNELRKMLDEKRSIKRA